MANSRDIRDRISSIKNTQKITRAMKMVAAARVKKSEMQTKANRPFSLELGKMFYRILSSVGEYTGQGTLKDYRSEGEEDAHDEGRNGGPQRQADGHNKPMVAERNDKMAQHDSQSQHGTAGAACEEADSRQAAAGHRRNAAD